MARSFGGNFYIVQGKRTGGVESVVAAAFDSDAQAIFDAMTTPPTAGRKTVINTLVVALKNAGIWTKLDRLWVLAAETNQAGRLNWKSPGTDTLSEVNSPTFTADQGWAGNGTNSYLQATWTPSTGPNYTQNSATFFGRSNTDTRADSAACWGVRSTHSALLNPWNNSANSLSTAINNSNTNEMTPTSAKGFFVTTRNAAGNYDIYRNGTTMGNLTLASSGVDTGAWRICGCGSASPQFTNRQISFGGVGAGLSSTEVTALYNAAAAYMTSIGLS